MSNSGDLQERKMRESIVRPQAKIKKAHSKIGRADWTEINLAFRPPYDWQTIIRFYISHPIPGIERVTEESFERVFRLGTKIGFFHVQATVNKSKFKLRIVAAHPKMFVEIVRRVRRMFDLDADPIVIANCFALGPVRARRVCCCPCFRV